MFSVLLALGLFAQTAQPYRDWCNTNVETSLGGLVMRTLVYCAQPEPKIFDTNPHFAVPEGYFRAESVSSEPVHVDCRVEQPVERPGVFDVHVIAQFADGHSVHNFVSEHSSRKSALKACDQVMTAQEKRWKQERKKK